MYHITRFPLLLVLILLAAPALSRARPPGKQLERFLKKEILPELPAGARLQLSVRDATNGKIIFSRQGDANCVPASTLKLLTAGLALNTLGPEFCFNTHLALRPDSIRCDTIYGDIVLTADGDPTLTTVDLEDLSAAFVSRVSGGQNTPVRVRGDLLLSTAVFDTLYRGPGWMWDDGDRPWAADITPFIVNRNCIGLECVQGEQGQRLYWLPALQLFPVSMGGGSTVRRLAGNRFEIGNGAFDLEPVLRVRNLEEPQLVYSLALKQLLAEQGVVVSGEVRLNHLPDSSSTDTFSTVHRSVPLAELSGPLLRQSNNLYAEALFKRCAFETTGKPGSWRAGAKQMHSWLVDSLGLATDGQIVDGSGMSRYNLVAPNRMTAALYRFQLEDWFGSFRAALPVMGRHGTVADREINLPGNIVRAKTGSLRNHKLITGYIEREGAAALIFFINIDGFTTDSRRMTELQDQIIHYLATIK